MYNDKGFVWFWLWRASESSALTQSITRPTEEAGAMVADTQTIKLLLPVVEALAWRESTRRRLGRTRWVGAFHMHLGGVQHNKTLNQEPNTPPQSNRPHVARAADGVRDWRPLV